MNYHHVKKKQFCPLALSALLVMLPCTALASSPSQPDAGKTLEGLKRPELSVPQKQDVKVAVEPSYKPPMQNNTGEKIPVKSFRITGQDLFSEAELDKLIADFQGKELSLNELQDAASRITDFFHAKGYIMARAYVPAQDIHDGQVEISVVVGRYGQIILRKQADILDSSVYKELGDVRTGAYIEKHSLERGIWLINDLSGVEAKATLAPGQQQGTADLIISILTKGKKNSGSITVDNYGNRFTGSTETILSDNISNPGRRGDRMDFNVTTTGSGLDSGDFTYQMPAFSPGGKIQIDYSQMHYQLGDFYSALDATGTAKTATISYIQTLKRSQAANLYAQIGFGDKRLQDKIGPSIMADKKAHLLTLALNGDSLDRWGGGGANSYSIIYTSGRLSSDGINASGGGAYTKGNINALRQQYISDRLSMMLSFNGQIANKSMDSSEKMSLGGAYGVRAYPKGEASGDIGYVATGELRWLLPLKDPKAGTLQLTGFIDVGSVENKASGEISEFSKRTLYGGGLGLVWNKPGDFTFRLNYAWKIGSETAQSDTDKNGRLWLLGTKYF